MPDQDLRRRQAQAGTSPAAAHPMPWMSPAAPAGAKPAEAADEEELQHMAATPATALAATTTATTAGRMRRFALVGRSRRFLICLPVFWCIAIFTLLVWFLRRDHALPSPISSSPGVGGGGGGGGGSGTHSGAPDESVSVTLRQGSYTGTVLPASKGGRPREVDAFLGVPYAEPPVGENRFRPPLRLAASSAAANATLAGPSCAAGGGDYESEDCLTVNVYRPRNALEEEGKKLPVALYVHGGAFNGGRGTERDMASFVAWADRDVIGVNFNYRVGALGFLPSALTAKEGLLNLGLRDQQMLFDWVRENIAAFGGDEDNVTLMGLSAGAHSLGHHLMHYTNSSAAPFHKAIIESGATTARAVLLPTHPRHLVQFREFLVAAGVEKVPEAEIFSALRKLPLSTVVRASRLVWNKNVPAVTWPFQPAIDGVVPPSSSTVASSSSPKGAKDDTITTVAPTNLTADPMLPDLPITSWRRGHHLRIPVITGFNTNEGTMFVPRLASTDADFRSFFRTLIPSLSDADAAALSALYPDPATAGPSSPYAAVPAGTGRQWARLDAAYAHYAYVCPVLQTADFLANATGGAGVRVYHYAARATAWDTANHGDHQPVVAHDMARIGGYPGVVKIADAMLAAWARFVALPPAAAAAAVDGDKDDDDALWPTTDVTGGRSRKVAVFGRGNDERVPGSKHASRGTPRVVEDLPQDLLDKCRFWWDRVELSEGLGSRTAPAMAAASS
ncbi:uncharacterized protein E0L32_010433 [Thyridium curvatum]|uniref:Carboxylesterase type B domain-containing protein n=1 Tax=Thyridium curvatum TaxID=1093900 RepID=A0A507ASK0_9PEZI|nr:uncharacterized protein E0L32_010433 [Thyridium curvatum]TPX07858.1 hypothetical protein E0L32_010433 [Thyridium curvatum]